MCITIKLDVAIRCTLLFTNENLLRKDWITNQGQFTLTGGNFADYHQYLVINSGLSTRDL